MRKTTVAALLLFAILSLVLTYPLALHVGNAVEDRHDALLNVWITAWDGHQLLNDPLHLFDANIFHTYPRTLAYSELLLGNALLALPITAVTGNPILGYNVALLLSFTLAGFGTYLLVLRLTRSPGAGLVSGIIFAFSSYQMSNLAQAQLLTTQWLPLALLSLHQLLRRPRPRHIITFSLFFCLQALSSFYYGILLALAAAGLVAWELLSGGLKSRDSASGARGRSAILYLVAAAACCALILLPFALPYFQVQRDLGFERSLADSEPFSASLRQYAMVPPNSALHGLWLPNDDTPLPGGYPVDALFPGLVAVGLAAWGLIRGRGRSRWFFVLLLVIAFVLSLGPRLYLAPGQPASFDAGLPYAWLYAIVPGFRALRAPVRFDALVMLSLAVLAGYGVASLRRGWIAALLAVLVVVEVLVWPAAQVEEVPTGNQVPPVVRWLEEQPAGAILELPMAFTPGGPKLDYQYLSTYHWQTTPDGFSGFFPPKHGQIVYEMERFPSERALRLLQALEVRYVVVHSDRFQAEKRQAMEEVLARSDAPVWLDDLSLAETFGADRVYEMRPLAFDPRDLTVSAYLPPIATTGEPYTAYLVAVNHGPWSYAVQPTDQVRPTATWDERGEDSETLTADMPLVTSGNGGAMVIPLALTAPDEPGPHGLSLGEDGGPLGTWSATGTVEVKAQGEGPGAFPAPIQLVDGSAPAKVGPGEPLPVDLTWRALGKIDAYYSHYVKLFDKSGNAIAGWDGQPQDGGAPTLLWAPGEAVEDTVTLTVPGNTPPGEYVVEVGVYRAEDLARVLTLDQEGALLDRVVVGTVQVEP